VIVGNAAEPAREELRHECDAAALHELKVTLHDGLSQELFAVELDLHELRCRTDLTPEVREIVDRIEARVRSGSAQLRCALLGEHTAAELSREPALALVTAVEAMLSQFAERHRITTALLVGGTGTRIDGRAARVLRRAVQEGLANVGKHARASQVQLALHRGDTWWSVQVDDDGAGDPDAIRAGTTGSRSFGLASLDADAARVGGRLCIAPAPSLGGVRLEVAVPVGSASVR
jgi:signal transduction histidine kinase